MAHDFKTFPELTNSQMDFYYFESPHVQIFEDFDARVINVHDGDTVTLRTEFRDFDFPLRLLEINAPELNEGGKQARDWLKKEIENEEVRIIMDRDFRVGKFGRLLGRLMHNGLDMAELMLGLNLVTKFEDKNQGTIPNIEKMLGEKNAFTTNA